MFTLSKNAFSSIHNGKCELHYCLSKLEEILNPEFYKKFKKVEELLSNGLEEIYKQEEIINLKRDKILDKIIKEHNLKTYWSIIEVMDFDQKFPFNSNKLYYPGGWGRSSLVPIEGETWLSLWQAADKAITMSGDQHHIFIEHFEQNKKDESELILHTGS